MKKFISFFTAICICLTFSFSFASSGSQYLFTGGFPGSNVQNLKYVLYGGTSSYQQNIMSAGAQLWNGISSKVNLSLNSSGAKISIYKSSNGPNDVMGESLPYYQTLGGLAFDINGTNVWYCADIRLYDDCMNGYSFTDDNKKSICAHEVGHMLSLRHNNSSSFLLMNPNALNTIGAAVPQSDDEANLKLKLGY